MQSISKSFYTVSHNPANRMHAIYHSYSRRVKPRPTPQISIFFLQICARFCPSFTPQMPVKMALQFFAQYAVFDTTFQNLEVDWTLDIKNS